MELWGPGWAKVADMGVHPGAARIGYLTSDGRWTANYEVFGARLLWAASTDRIFVADTESGRVTVYDEVGDHLTTFNVEFGQSIDPEARIAAHTERLQARAIETGSPLDLEMLRHTHFADTPAVFEQMVVGSRQHLWVGRSLAGAGLTEWTKLGHNGEVLAVRRLEGRIAVTDARFGHLLGITRDSLDVSFVVRFDLDAARAR